MMQAGLSYELKIIRKTDLGYMLGEENDDVLLHFKEAHGEHNIGDTLHVFIYFDKKGRLCATENEPFVSLNKPGFAKVCDEYGLNAVAPYSGAEFDMISGRFVKEGERIPKAKKPVQRKANDVFERLLAAGRRLLTVIKHNEGGANKDLAKFADQINSMCDKWDR